MKGIGTYINKKDWATPLTTIGVMLLVTTVYLLAFAHPSRTVSIKYSLSYILHFAGLIAIAVAMRNSRKGRISYLKSFLTLCLCGIAVSLVVGCAVYVYTTFFDTTLLIDRQSIMFNDIIASNSDILDTAGEASVRKTLGRYMSPLATALSTFAIIAVLSVIYAAIISIFAKRKQSISRNESFNRSSASE